MNIPSGSPSKRATGGSGSERKLRSNFLSERHLVAERSEVRIASRFIYHHTKLCYTILILATLGAKRLVPKVSITFRHFSSVPFTRETQGKLFLKNIFFHKHRICLMHENAPEQQMYLDERALGLLSAAVLAFLAGCIGLLRKLYAASRS